MLALLLMQKIAQLLLMVFFGYIIVKSGVLSTDDSGVLSKFSLYLIVPFSIYESFQKDFDPTVLHGLIEALIVSILVMVLLFALDIIHKNVYHMNLVERAAVLYPNTGNLIIPLVAAVFGAEWVIYSSSFFAAQIIVIWTIGIRQFNPNEPFNLKKIIFHPNIIAVFLGLISFLLNFRLPPLVDTVFKNMGDMLGPISMIITGMLFAGLNLKSVLKDKIMYLTLALRMLITPGLIFAIVFLLHITGIYKAGSNVLLIALLPACAPVASTVSQLAKLYTEDGVEAGGLCVFSTLLSILTMPLFVYLYEFLF